MNERICILSEPIRSGKTTALMQWVKQQTHVAGFLTPDADDLRKLYDLASQKIYDLQVPAAHDNTVHIGHFDFDKAVFAHAQQLMRDALNNDPAWLVIDEIGRLELDRKEGLEPALSEVIRHYNAGKGTGRLLLVIRDYLLEPCIAHYQLQDAVIWHRTDLEIPLKTGRS